MQRKKFKKKRISKNLKQCNLCVIRITEKEKEWNRKIFEVVTVKIFSKNIDRHQITDPGNSENAKKYKYQNTDTYTNYIQTAENQRQIENHETSSGSSEALFIKRNKDKNYKKPCQQEDDGAKYLKFWKKI